ncbi:thiamine pyrophosphate-binding protein [Pseudomonas guariconensis]|uniref:thiamine pyrophosphate-binding protein n=1 Tax=Pseudomonas guariconensis TaxID=1288410 RepID=UPI0025AA22DE|nr:thiamine pyrophosphate-binding protein [Pseudomonas guariconensis]MDM9593128.1 thiamine pyrophosphate-binding protein [Pseudomonas guariconensis]MDM9605955.1 thiamine pyrophosphate-binding protein [Pseudomonas guariconensis]MDM9610912.1 thiamine pyrophosphate-binding protein [Pseudomonas guariconensis]
MPSHYRVADYIADFIAKLGVEHVFLLPGGGAMHLNDAVGKHPDLDVVACHHEQAAAIAAEAYCRINENIGVAMVTTGPGATNAVTAVAGAWIESVPLLIISGQVKRADLLRGAPLRQKGVQEVDIISVVEPITKYAVTIQQPEDIRRELERAVFLAKDGRAGPVWIDVPLDVQGAPIDPDTLVGWKEGVASVTELDAAALEQIRGLLEDAQRPLILAGHGVRLSGAAAAFREVIESMGVPLVTTWNAMDLLPHEHPLYVGRPGVVALRAPNFAVQNADLLIAVGCRLDNIITAYAPRDFARGARKVVVDVDSNEIAKLDMEIDVAVTSDAASFITTLADSLKGASFSRPQWLQRCQDWKARYGVNDGKPFPGSGPISHFQFADALSNAVPENTLVSTGSSGLAVEVFYTVFRNRPGQRVFLTSGLGAMGYGLPAAIGACFANGCKPMVAVESDGSLQLNIQELATLRGFNLPICLVVMNNGGYASIRNTQRNYFESRYVGTGPEAGLWMPDLEELARAYHLPFKRISDVAELEQGLAEAVRLPSPMIVEVLLMKDEALSPKVAAIPQADGSMTSMPLEDMSPMLPLAVLEEEMAGNLTPVSRRVRRQAK